MYISRIITKKDVLLEKHG